MPQFYSELTPFARYPHKIAPYSHFAAPNSHTLSITLPVRFVRAAEMPMGEHDSEDIGSLPCSPVPTMSDNHLPDPFWIPWKHFDAACTRKSFF
ncbi:MAG: hypothetical protein IPH82_02440 [Chloroflexi bacterium]|nr:hypothetical protein [Chloroflexota bacterium]